MAESVISFAVQTIGNLLTEEANFLHGVKDQVEELQQGLKRMQWFLKDADSRKGEDQRIHEWILEVKDIAYDAEDLVEKYAFRAGSSRDGGLFEFLNRCVCVLNDLCFRHVVGSEIQALNTKITRLKSDFQTYGIRAIMERESSSSVQQQTRRTYSFVDEEDFVGLESDVDLLVKQLVSEDHNACHGVVSITGLGGLGKTTIAKKVYNHPSVKRHFNGLAWICVSQQWQANEMLQKIMIKLVPSREQEIRNRWTDDELKRELFKIQQQKKCLIVLDDIWTTDAWDCIKAAFPTGQQGSKILLTTRNTDVAMCISPNGFLHQPQFLNDDQSWELLWRKALRTRHDEGLHISELECLGKQMVKHCAGLPLAVVVLGGILLTKNSLIEWEAVNQDVKYHILKGKRSEVETILGLSYFDLPYHLKPCFLYLGSFGEDTEIEANTIYQVWIAEGMVLRDREGKESLMEVAEQYLGELGQRGMVQLQTLDFPRMRRRFKSCHLHDLVRELCLHEAEEGIYLKYIHDPFSPLSSSPSSSKLRRLTVAFDGMDMLPTPEKNIRDYLRMLRLELVGHGRNSISRSLLKNLAKFKVLRVLSLENYAGAYGPSRRRQEKLPKEIGNLIHLSYLSLRRSNFDIFPSSLGNLKQLQTLDLRLAFAKSFPNILWKFKNLTCLYLPRELGWRRNKRLDGLNMLEICEGFQDIIHETKDLVKMTNLRVLRAIFYHFDCLEMIADYIESSNRLEHVFLETWVQFDKERERGLVILKKLLFGRSTHTLIIREKIWEFPEYESNLSSSLVKLHILVSGLDAAAIFRTVEKFTHLRDLYVSGAKGKELCFHAQGFPQLQRLDLREFEEIEKWVVEEGAMPQLRTILLSDFPNLVAIPNGLHFISTIENLHFSGMSQEFEERITNHDGEIGLNVHISRYVPAVPYFKLVDPSK